MFIGYEMRVVLLFLFTKYIAVEGRLTAFRLNGIFTEISSSILMFLVAKLMKEVDLV